MNSDPARAFNNGRIMGANFLLVAVIIKNISPSNPLDIGRGKNWELLLNCWPPPGNILLNPDLMT